MATEKMLREKEAAEMMGIGYFKLLRWRQKGVPNGTFPIPFARIGATIFYKEEDIKKFIESVTYRPKIKPQA